ncbi:hypothetical protein [Rhizobium sp. 768_B6_N1_8]|uniref:hypothetical protein n=1 Tax=unclassified Rhizobium TaxID=2613769 RepID=UPI003F1F6F8A
MVSTEVSGSLKQHDAGLSAALDGHDLFKIVRSLSSSKWSGAIRSLFENQFRGITEIRMKARAYGLREMPALLPEMNLGPRPQYDWRRRNAKEAQAT